MLISFISALSLISLIQSTISMTSQSTAISASRSDCLLTILSPGCTISGSPLRAGRGPEMLVKVVPVGSVSSEFVTEFRTAGINQTRHKVYIRIRANMRIVIPTGAREVEVVAQVPVAETVIVGQVPQSYVNVDSTEDMLNLLPDMSGS